MIDIKNRALKLWIDEVVSLCQPDSVHLCDGSQKEYNLLCQQMVDSGMLIKLDPTLRSNSFLARSDPGDVARVEDRTFICSRLKGELLSWIYWEMAFLFPVYILLVCL